MSYRIVFAGTGIIGAGLAVNAVLSGNEVRIFDVLDKESVLKNIQSVIETMIRAGAVEKDKAFEKLERVHVFSDLQEALANGADMIQECVPEQTELKKQTYRIIQEMLGNDTIICSSTSAIMPSVLAEDALYPENILVGHPYNPSYLLPLIEICGPHASPDAISKAVSVYKAMGKIPIICRKESKGFIANNMSWQVFYAAAECVKNGLCSVEEADKALMYGPGLRMAVLGQLLTLSLGTPGGFPEYPKKYGLPNDPIYDLLGQGISDEIANRSQEQGQTVEDVIAYRDKMFVQILKMQGIL